MYHDFNTNRNRTIMQKGKYTSYMTLKRSNKFETPTSAVT